MKAELLLKTRWLRENPPTFCACSRLMWIAGNWAWQFSKEHPGANAGTASLAVALSSITGQTVGPVCTRNQSTMGGDLREGIMPWGCSKAISNSFTPLLCTVMRNRILKIHSWKKTVHHFDPALPGPSVLRNLLWCYKHSGARKGLFSQRWHEFRFMAAATHVSGWG